MADSPAKNQFPTFIIIIFFCPKVIILLPSVQKNFLFIGYQKHFLRLDSFSIGEHRTSLRYFRIVCLI